MISVGLNPSGQVEIVPRKGSPARAWLEELSCDKFFASPESELSVAFSPSDMEEFNEDWSEYALPGVIAEATAWSGKFAPSGGVLRFYPSEKFEVAGFLNRCRLKIAMEGTGDVLPPPTDSPRRSQYEFLTALMEFVLSLPAGD